MATGDPKIISRQEAIVLGLRHYFTGTPCLRGHISLRITKKSYCVQCKNDNERIRTSHGPGLENRLAYAGKNREKLKADARERYRKNPDPYKKRANNWKILNPEAARLSAIKRTATWRSKNREMTHIWRRIKRARKLENGGSHTIEDIADIFRIQRGKCAYCKKKVTMANKHVDHIVPISRGGSNNRNNLQILCKRCNLRKSAKDPIDYARTQGMLL